MIEFILGKTGSGKSYLALKRIVEFLASSDDGYVVTNLAIRAGELNAWMKENYRGEADVVGRVRQLSDQEAREFYLHRERGCDLQLTSKQEQQNLVFPDFEKAANSSKQVLYVIDEAHIFFDSREWANVGLTLNYFASQHRKFRSDIILITQFLDQVEKRLRNHATLFHECQNLASRRFMLWRMPKYFRSRQTYKAPPCPPDFTSTYRIDKSLADCYDTTAGVGVAGGRKPEPVRQKGFPMWTAGVAVLAFCVVLWFTPDVFGRVLGFGLNRMGSHTAAVVGGVPPAPGGSVHSPGGSPGAPGPGAPKEKTERVTPRFFRGYMVRGDRAIVVLDDGRTVTEKDAEFGGLARRGNAVWIDGEKLWRRESPRPAEVVKQMDPPGVTKNQELGETLAAREYHGEAVEPTAESAARVSAAMGGVGAAGGPVSDNQKMDTGARVMPSKAVRSPKWQQTAGNGGGGVAGSSRRP